MSNELTPEKLADLEFFQALLPKVRQYVKNCVPSHWTELRSVMSGIIDQPLGPLSLLPLASCAAVGGDPEQAIAIAAAWEVLNLAIRIVDDLQDQDRTQGLWNRVGVARAFNFSAALYALCHQLLNQASWSADLYRQIDRNFAQTGLQLLQGQDQDLRNQTHTLEDYWQTIEAKNGAGFALACGAGAICGTTDVNLIEACRRFGHHLGIVLQLFDDFEGLWYPSGLGDLDLNKITLPLIYGLNITHPRQQELQILVNQGNLGTNANQVRDILDSISTRDFIIWTALKEREQALMALESCPVKPGVMVLTAYVNTIFTQIEELTVINA